MAPKTKPPDFSKNSLKVVAESTYEPGGQSQGTSRVGGSLRPCGERRGQINGSHWRFYFPFLSGFNKLF